jgi:hypothetical protein
MSKNEATMALNATQDPAADSLLQPAPSHVVNTESAAASSEFPTSLDAQPTTLVQGGTAGAAMATSTGCGIFGEQALIPVVGSEEREEGECFSSCRGVDEMSAMETTGGLPLYTGYTAFHNEPDNFLRMLRCKVDDETAKTPEAAHTAQVTPATEMSWDAPGAFTAEPSNGEHLEFLSEPRAMATSTSETKLLPVLPSECLGTAKNFVYVNPN